MVGLLVLTTVIACGTAKKGSVPTLSAEARFSVRQVDGTLAVRFTNRSGDVDESEWDFGDGAPVDMTESPEHTYAAAGTYTVRLTVTLRGETDSIEREIEVDPLPIIPPAGVTLTAAPNPLNAGSQTTLTWVVTNATSCTASGAADFAGARDATGGISAVLVNADTTYRLDCDGPGGAGFDLVNVVVNVAFTSQAVTAGTNLKQLGFSWTVSGTTGVDHFEIEINPDGSSGFSQVDLNGDGVINGGDDLASTDRSVDLSIPLHLTDFNDARYQIVARDAGDNEVVRSGELFIVGILVEALTGYVKASNTDVGDFFGQSASISGDGNTLAVGAIFEAGGSTGINGNQSNNASFNTSGAVYVFARDATGTWSQQAYVKASNTDAIDVFGAAVSLSTDGNTMAVGASFEDSNATGIGGNQSNDTEADSGAVYVFSRTPAGVWSQQAYVKASNTDPGDGFGTTVSLSGDGNTLAVGATNEDSSVSFSQDNSAAGQDFGAVYIFTRTGTVWSQQDYIKSGNVDSDDEFGTSLSLSENGDRLAVGLPLEDSNAVGVLPCPCQVDGPRNNTETNSGAVYIFERSPGGNWTETVYFKASNTDPGDAFGTRVALSADGNTLAVGADGEDSSAFVINGAQFLNGASGAGAVYVFVRSEAGLWSQQAYIKASNTDAGDGFGGSLASFGGEAVSLSADGNTLAVGATGEKGDSIGTNGNENDAASGTSFGAAYVFVRSSGATWTQKTYVKASNTDANDEFGTFVTLSGDGNTLAVGARVEAGNSAGVSAGNFTIQGNNGASGSGAVYLY